MIREGARGVKGIVGWAEYCYGTCKAKRVVNVFEIVITSL